MPIGPRQYQMAVALPGQRMSYQDYTHHKGYYDQCTNAETKYFPFGLFAAQATSRPVGELSIPAAATDKILGIVPIQGHWEAGGNGEVGIPPKYPMSFAYKGIFAVQSFGAIDKALPVAIAADASDPNNQGKVVQTATYTPVKLAIPGTYRVVRVLAESNLVIIEIDFPSTQLSD